MEKPVLLISRCTPRDKKKRNWKKAFPKYNFLLTFSVEYLTIQTSGFEKEKCEGTKF